MPIRVVRLIGPLLLNHINTLGAEATPISSHKIRKKLPHNNIFVQLFNKDIANRNK